MDVLLRENNVYYNILCFLITENEKLFDRSDAKLYWRTVLHILSLLHHGYSAIFANSLSKHLKNSSEANINMLFTYRAGYLTGWNFAFQTLFLFLAFSHDVLEWMGKHHNSLASKIKYWRDVLFSGLVVPYTCFVFGMFWSIYSIDRELVFPKVYDEVIPWWFNQCVHTNILVMVVVETLLQPRRRPTDNRLELIFNAAVGILYAIVYYTIYFLTNRWLYNVFGIMTWWQVCIFQCCIWLSSYIFYRLQFPINRLIHGSEVEDTKYQTGEITNGEAKSEENMTNENGDNMKNGEHNIKNGDDGDTNTFSKSWSLKYRTLRGQLEKTSL